jgi:hypothetical protein
VVRVDMAILAYLDNYAIFHIIGGVALGKKIKSEK